MKHAAARPGGLTAAEARERLAAEGPNALPAEQAKSALALAAGIVREPMFALLIAASAIYLLLGDLQEALVLAASIVAVISITLVQERRTERALAALRDLSSPRALVVRDGREQRIAGVDVVRGDLLVLREGDRVPADATLVEAHDLLVDESLLTGESVAVSKRAGEGAGNRVMSGTLVVRGLGRATATATGPRSELGRIGATLAGLQPGKTSLERETARLVRFIAVGGVALCAVVAALYTATRGSLLDGLLAGLTLAMAILPEEFPVVLTVFLALGAWRIGRQGVLTRRMPAIEMLGAATVLCCDKTGTLTENRMAVSETWIAGAWRGHPAAEETRRGLLENAAFACEPAPVDPMDRAIIDAARDAGGDARAGFTLERRRPMASGFLAVVHAWRDDKGRERTAMKGAPETVLGACAKGDAEREAALSAASDAARRGLRVLAVAVDEGGSGAFRFLGLVALADPIRATVPAAIELCRRAGVRVVMITGDHPETARAIAAQAGLAAGRVATGSELEAATDDDLAGLVREVNVFARVRPEQKLRLVQALRAAGEVVAMTGDGVNDAPALKAADIGIAMGARGTDVAREAASLVLLEDDFTSVVATIRLGRRIYDNIRNAMRYLVAVHVPIAGMALIPLAAGWPVLFFPVHVVFMEFVIDPACSIVFEAEHSDPKIMERPPRPPSQHLFDAASLALAGLLGASVLAGTCVLLACALGAGRSAGEANAMAFTSIIAGNLMLILANRSRTRTVFEGLASGNRALAWILAGTLIALAATIYAPAAARLFRFEPIGPGDVMLALAAGALPVFWYDLVKLRGRRRA